MVPPARGRCRRRWGAGKHGVEKSRVQTRGGDPLIKDLVGRFVYFDADAGTLSPAQLDRSLHQHLEDGVRVVYKGVRELLHALHLQDSVTVAKGSSSEGRVRSEIEDLKAGIFRSCYGTAHETSRAAGTATYIITITAWAGSVEERVAQ